MFEANELQTLEGIPGIAPQ